MPSLRAAALATLASLAVVGCELSPSDLGKPCRSDDDCGGVFFCELEVEPNVCVPGPPGVPRSPPNHAPVVESALVVVVTGVADEPPAAPLRGSFRARDPDGDGVRFVPATVEGPLGNLTLAADGTYSLALPSPLPAVDDAEPYVFEIEDDRVPPARASGVALVSFVTQAPSELARLWRGSASSAFDDEANWQPAGLVDKGTSALVGPGAERDLTVADGATASVNGLVSTSARALLLGSPGAPATLVVGGARVFSGAPVPHGTVEVTPAEGFAGGIALAGEMPTLVVRKAARLLAPLHARGDVRLVEGSGLFEVTSLVVEGDLVQEAGGTRLSTTYAGAPIVVGGDLSLRAPQNRLDGAFLHVGGELRVDDPSSATAGAVTLLLDGESAVSIAAPERFRFSDVTVARGAVVRFESSLFVDDQLSLAGRVSVARGAVLHADTLVVRVSMATDDDNQGEIHAERCFFAARVVPPAWIRCREAAPAPPSFDDAGAAGPGEPDAGPPARCDYLGDSTFDDQLLHDLVVVAANFPRTVEDRLEVSAGEPGLEAGFEERSVGVRTGVLALESDGSFAFTPTGKAGFDELEIVTSLGGGQMMSGACAQVRAVDTSAMNVLIGSAWDDPASWSLGRVPDDGDDVFVPASADAHVAQASGPPLAARRLFVESGAVLDTRGRDLAVTLALVVGGSLATGAGAAFVSAADGEVAGRVHALGCGDNLLRVSSDVRTTTLRPAAGASACRVDLGQERLTVDGALALAAPLEVRSQDGRAALVVEGSLDVPALTGILNAGELQLKGAADVGAWSVAATEAHRLSLLSTAGLALPSIDYGGFLIVVAADGDAPLVIESGGFIQKLFALRPVNVSSGVLRIEAVMLNELFRTDTPDAFDVEQCLGTASAMPSFCPAP